MAVMMWGGFAVLRIVFLITFANPRIWYSQSG
jgi:hypothetical protein